MRILGVSLVLIALHKKEDATAKVEEPPFCQHFVEGLSPSIYYMFHVHTRLLDIYATSPLIRRTYEEAHVVNVDDRVKGTLMSLQGVYYSIKDADGREMKVHVDRSTKLDKVMVGDKVKAYITDRGHTTTLQRDE